MKYTFLGNTGIKVSRICAGCMSYGRASESFHLWTLGPEATREMVAHAFDLGINFFDTANCYSEGTSEEYLGRALRELHIPRERTVIASKVFFNEGHLSKKAIMREVDGSLKRLGTDYLDLYQIHRFDKDTPVVETLDALDELVKSGKVRALGASAMYGYQFHNLQHAAEQNALTPFSTLQNHYNLLYREDERELIPVARQYGVSLIPYSPLAGGHLSRSSWDGDSKRGITDRAVHEKYDGARGNDQQIIARVAGLSEGYGVSMSVIALAWLLKKGVTAPIVGATKPHHFDDAVQAADFELTDGDMAYLEEPYCAHELVGLIR